MTIQKSDRTILVTGGSRGLGLALVRTLLAEGYRVGTCSRSLTDVLRQLLAEPANQGRVHWRECEVGNEPSEDKYCLLYTSDAADEEDSVDLGGRRIIKKKK